MKELTRDDITKLRTPSPCEGFGEEVIDTSFFYASLGQEVIFKEPKMSEPLRTLYPEIEPYMIGMLQVSSIHHIYFEQCGNPHGLPVVVLHGGPGAGSSPQLRQFFDPKAYRIILFDQRGCGRSEPFLELRENTTQHLINDIEVIRQTLGIATWVVFGGSWGSTLALAYAEEHPKRVNALILRGIFLGRRKEIDWLYEGGLSIIAGERWERFIAPIPPAERGNMVEAYWRRLAGGPGAITDRAAREWWRWELACAWLVIDDEGVELGSSDMKFVSAISLIECHYFRNKCFLEADQLLHGARRIGDIPGVIVQGFYDLVCPAGSAWELHKAWPKSELRMSYRSGHAAGEPENTHNLVVATDKFRDRFLK